MGWLCALGAGVLGPGGAMDHAGAAGVGTGSKMKIFLEVFVNRRINLPRLLKVCSDTAALETQSILYFRVFFSYIPWTGGCPRGCRESCRDMPRDGGAAPRPSRPSSRRCSARCPRQGAPAAQQRRLLFISLLSGVY